MRLVTCGFETGSVAVPASGTPYGPEGEGQEYGTGSGAMTAETSVVHGGAYSARYVNESTNACIISWPVASVDGRSYFARLYFRKSANPDTKLSLLAFPTSFNVSGRPLGYHVQLQTDGTLRLAYHTISDTPNHIGSASAALSNDVWYRIELMIKHDADHTGDAALRLATGEGASSEVASETNRASTEAPTLMYVGVARSDERGGNLKYFYYDDIALNDSVPATGFSAGDYGAQDTYPGRGKQYLLKPTSDNARHADWVGGAGGTTNLWDAVNNTPPVGVTGGGSTNTSQIKNTNEGGAAEDYDANLQTYDAAGVDAADGIMLVQTFANTGVASSGPYADMGALKSVSNPAEGSETIFDPARGTSFGTFPAGWITRRGPVIHLPSVSKGTAPVLRLGKRGASSVRMDADLMGLYVEAGVPASGAGYQMMP